MPLTCANVRKCRNDYNRWSWKINFGNLARGTAARRPNVLASRPPEGSDRCRAGLVALGPGGWAFGPLRGAGAGLRGAVRELRVLRMLDTPTWGWEDGWVPLLQ
jgi:hypothetical protein